MFKNKLLVVVFSAAGILMSAGASAQVYVGGTIGQSRWNDDCKLTTKCDTISTAYKLFGGYNLDKNFALETSYFSLGKMNATANVNALNANVSVEGTGFELAGVAKTDFTEDFGGFAKIGVARVKADANSVVSGLGKYSQDTTSTQPVLGLGLTYKISKELAVRGEFEMRRMKLGSDKDNVRNVSVGLQYAF